ncbi:MAG TPA: nitroreductase family protein [Candidatus Angelobacter sp.]|nr:nitroreductase family protein [Candidatus Angelobacter sp.]
MANQVFDTARTLLALRQYEDRPVPPEVIRRVVEAGRFTASAMNGQPWHFVVVRDRARLATLGKLVRTGPYIAQAAFAIVVGNAKKDMYGVSDCSRAIQTMLLTAWAEGVGSNWTGFGGLDAVRSEVGLPEGYDVLAVLPFGYPARSVKGIKKRKPLAQVASAERFGTPFA